MEDNRLVLAIWRKIDGCRLWSGGLLRHRATDDLDSWLVNYRSRLAAGSCSVSDPASLALAVCDAGAKLHDGPSRPGHAH